MKSFLLIACLFTAIYTQAQITYQQGYIVNNQGKKTECLIKNVAWKNNPTRFDYKISESSEAITANLQDVVEFSVADAYKFRRFTLDIDRASEDVNHMSDFREPDWKKETLFLRVLVEGKLNLYQYEDDKIVKYFYSEGSNNAVQLLYKQYKVNGGIKENAAFRQQLYNLMKDSGKEARAYERLRYRRDDLLPLFIDYNSAGGQESSNLAERHNKGKLQLKVTAGAGLAMLKIDNSSGGLATGEHELKNSPVYRVGVELEYILPFNNNKWSLFFDPNISFYKNDDTTKFSNSTATFSWDVTYNYLELPAGARYYMFLNNDSKIFIDLGYALAVNLGSAKIRYNNALDYDISNSANLITGIGYNYKSLSAEVRYGFGRGLLNDYSIWDADYSTVSLILAYKIL